MLRCRAQTSWSEMPLTLRIALNRPCQCLIGQILVCLVVDRLAINVVLTVLVKISLVS